MSIHYKKTTKRKRCKSPEFQPPYPRVPPKCSPPMAPQPTPVDPISESELPTNPGSTPKKISKKARKLSVPDEECPEGNIVFYK